MNNNFSFVFFGSSPISVTALDALLKAGMTPKAVVTQIDRPQGRGLTLVATPVKIWAEDKRIPVEFFDTDKETFLKHLAKYEADVFVLVSYGRMLPDEVLSMPRKGVVNLHPSLLPKLRGPSPIESSILLDMKDETGVSIMLLTQKMDEGPILAQKQIEIPNWPPKRSELYKILSEEGANLLAQTLPLWVADKIEPLEQDHALSTYSKMIEKEDAEINLDGDPYKNYLKIQAYEGRPGAFFFKEHAGKKIRVKITDASFENNELHILKVIPEGKKEMTFGDFNRGF
jgi:methionyl-tRNA formyltransferase